MSNEAYAFALGTTISEIKNAFPDLSTIFIFKENGTILAKDKNTTKEKVNKTVTAFNTMTERATAIGGVESVTFNGANGRVNIARINNFYLTTTTSKKTDEKYLDTLTHILVPTVLRLVEKIHPDSIEDDILSTLKPEPAGNSNVDEITDGAEYREEELPVEETLPIKPKPEQIDRESGSEVSPASSLPEPPVNQFMVDDLGGFLVPSDTVRIESAVIVRWKNLYPGKKIEEVAVETLHGKTTSCKFKPIKASKHLGTGKIRMPHKIQRTLQTTKGELVMVKPVVR